MENTTNQMPKVGDVFASSWGYEQLNIDYYQVTRVMKKQIGVRMIAEDRKYSEGGMSGHSIPRVGEFTTPEQRFKVRFTPNGKPYFKPASYATARLTDPTKEHFFSEWH